MNISRKALAAILCSAMGGVALIGGTVAYLTDYDVAANEFTVGKVDIDLLEPKWDPEEHKNLVPTEEIEKDPQIKNVGVNDAFVYLEVSVPVRNVLTSDKDGNRREAADTELFTFEAGEAWTLMQSFLKDGYQVYQYSFNDILKPQDTTAPLFETMTFANLIEGQLDGAQLTVPVRAYAIQTVHTGDEGSTIPEKAKEAFDKYMNQNTAQPGAAAVKA